MCRSVNITTVQQQNCKALPALEAGSPGLDALRVMLAEGCLWLVDDWLLPVSAYIASLLCKQGREGLPVGRGGACRSIANNYGT